MSHADVVAAKTSAQLSILDPIGVFTTGLTKTQELIERTFPSPERIIRTLPIAEAVESAFEPITETVEAVGNVGKSITQVINDSQKIYSSIATASSGVGIVIGIVGLLVGLVVVLWAWKHRRAFL